MLSKVELRNFGPLVDFKWDQLGQINLVIGRNGSGKTFLLKALYCVIRTLEEYKRGDDQRSAMEILADKLYWTFQPEKIGDLTTKGADGQPLFCSIAFDSRVFSFSFGKDTAKHISTLENHVDPRTSNSIFLPAKEVLSLFNIIKQSREVDRVFGFDDTYLDLVRALSLPLKQSKNYAEFAESRQSLEDILGGKVEYDEDSRRWQFRNRTNQKFPIGTTAEGVKKIAILDTLLANRYLDVNSTIFIDEPESALHPEAVSKLLDIIAILAERGIQFFLATHSYFVIKKLFLIAQEKGMPIPVISAGEDGWSSSDLKDDFPDNPIIDESIRLYKEEVELAL